MLECCLPTSGEIIRQSAASSDLKKTDGSDLKPDVASDKMDVDDDLKTGLARLNLATITGSSTRLTALQEIQSLVCCYLHEAFIADPNLAKLVHFQGYPIELLPVTVAGVPSMHICLDFAPELLSQPSLEKQVFAIDLISHLSVQYSLPKSLSTARLAVNSVSTLLTVLSSESREELFLSTLPAMERLCEAFPPLTEDVVSLLVQGGRMCISSASLNGYSAPSSADLVDKFSQHKEVSELMRMLPATEGVCEKLATTFSNILSRTVLSNQIY